VDYLPKRLLTPERLNTSVRLALRRIEKRVARRLATLTHVTESPAPEAHADAKKPTAAGVAAVGSSSAEGAPTNAVAKPDGDAHASESESASESETAEQTTETSAK